MAEREIERWITVNGTRVPIFAGESEKDAINRSIAKSNSDKMEQDIKRNKEQAEKASATEKGSKKSTNVEVISTAKGNIMRIKDKGKDKYLYVSKVKKDGTFDYVTDYTYAKKFSSNAVDKLLGAQKKGK